MLLVSALCACNDDPPPRPARGRGGPTPTPATTPATTMPTGCTEVTGSRYSLCGGVAAAEPTLQGKTYGVTGTPGSNQSMISDPYGVNGGFHAAAQ